ncbi:hypothetical protein LX36DRAFT_676176 [Colletotrichum falcatum]|nr:hypothetical protein LX36DRAFT_676176 [Colletotrichum falcatum]
MVANFTEDGTTVVFSRWVPERSLITTAVLGLVALVTVLGWRRGTKVTSGLDQLDWVGPKNGLLSRLRWSALFRKDGVNIVQEGYVKFSKTGKPFVTRLATIRPIVVVPTSDVDWLSKLTRKLVLPPQLLIQQQMSTYYHPNSVPKEFTHMPTINVYMKRVAVQTIWDLVQEVIDSEYCQLAAEGRPGDDDDNGWKDVVIFDFVGQVIARITTGIFLSPTLAQDDEFIANVTRYTLMFNLCPYQVHYAVPKAIRAVFGYIVSAPTRYYLRKIDKKMVPRIQQMLSGHVAEEDTETVLKSYITAAVKSADPVDQDVGVIASRFTLIIGALAIPTMFQTVGDALVNLARGPPHGATFNTIVTQFR